MTATNNQRGTAGKASAVSASLPLQRTWRVAPNEGFQTQPARIESSGDLRLGFDATSTDELARFESLRKPPVPTDDWEQLGPRMKPFGYPDRSIDLIDSRYQPDLRFNE